MAKSKILKFFSFILALPFCACSFSACASKHSEHFVTINEKDKIQKVTTQNIKFEFTCSDSYFAASLIPQLVGTSIEDSGLKIQSILFKDVHLILELTFLHLPDYDKTFSFSINFSTHDKTFSSTIDGFKIEFINIFNKKSVIFPSKDELNKKCILNSKGEIETVFSGFALKHINPNEVDKIKAICDFDLPEKSTCIYSTKFNATTLCLDITVKIDNFYYLSETIKGKITFELNGEVLKNINDDICTIKTDKFDILSIPKEFLKVEASAIFKNWQDEASISKYNSLIIPNEMPETSFSTIAVNGFINAFQLEKNNIIYIGFESDNIKVIGDYAFQNCSNIRFSVNMCASCFYISSYAFQGCTNVPSFVFSESLEKIDQYAFENTGIVKEKFYKKLQTVENHAFANCVHLKELDFSDYKNEIPQWLKNAKDNNIFENCSQKGQIFLDKDAKVNEWKQILDDTGFSEWNYVLK